MSKTKSLAESYIVKGAGSGVFDGKYLKIREKFNDLPVYTNGNRRYLYCTIIEDNKPMWVLGPKPYINGYDTGDWGYENYTQSSEPNAGQWQSYCENDPPPTIKTGIVPPETPETPTNWKTLTIWIGLVILMLAAITLALI